jgi:hypothetical protein
MEEWMVDCPYCSRADDGVQKVMGTATPPPVPAAPPTELAPASPMRATVVDGYTAHFRTPPGATVVDGVAADTPSPRPAGDIPLQGWLVVMSGAAKFRDLRLDRERLVIGSGPGSDLRLEETGVAPCHARVVKERDGVYLVGADGAVFLNNSQQPSLRHPLADEDLFKIGSVYLKYRRL